MAQTPVPGTGVWAERSIPARLHLEVQTVLRHAPLGTTDLYTAVRLDDLLDQLAEHCRRPAEPARWSATYDAVDIAAVLGGR